MAKKRKLEASPGADRSELHRLLDAAKADHWDDGPRLALADWLEENGGEPDKARAEVIRLQLDASNGGPPWRAAAEQIRDRHVREWMPTNRDVFTHLLPTCERGLLAGGGSGADWGGGAAPDEAWRWVETARPSFVRMRELPAMLAAPRLRSVAHLDLGSDRRGVAALHHLCDAAALPRRLAFGCSADNLPLVARRLRPGLEGLTLWAHGGYSHGMGIRPLPCGDLLRSEAAAGLRCLILRWSGPSEGDAPLLAALPSLPSLRRLRLNGSHLTPASLPTLAGPSLRSLSLVLDGLPLAAVASLQDSACRDTLEELTVSHWHVGPVAAFSLPRLHRLSLTEGSLSAAKFATLAEGGTFAGLTVLDLSENALGAAGVSALAASLPEGPRLLALSACALRDAGVRRLAAWRGLSSVRVLMLDDNDITDAGLLTLAESPHTAALEGLSLRNNRRLTPAGLGPLLRSPLAARLTWLSLAYIGGGGAEAAPFEDAPPPRLRELRLGRRTRWTRVPGRLATLKAAMPGCAIE